MKKIHKRIIILMTTSIMPYLKLFFACFIWTLSQNAIAQDVDSLMTIFRNVKTSDSVRTHLINKEALEYLIFKNAFSHPDNAISYGNSLLDFSNQKQLKINMGIACDIIGTAYIFKGDHRNSLDYFLEGLQIKESIHDSITRKARVLQASYTNLGELYLNEKDIDNAYIYYSKSLAISETMNDINARSSSYTDMGNFYKQKKEYDLANDYYLKSLKILKNTIYTLEYQGNLADLGDINFEKGSLNQSILYYRESIENIAIKNDLATVRSYIGLSKAYSHQADSIYNITKKIERSKYLEAIKFGKEGIDLAQNSGFLKYVEEGSKNLYDLYKTLGDTEKSLKMHELYFKSRDSLRSLNAEKEILILKYKEEYEKEKLNNQLVQQKLANKRNLLFASIFTILLISIIFLIQKNIKARQSKKQLLTELEALKSNSPNWHLNTSGSKIDNSPHFDKEKIEQFIDAKLNPTDWKILNLLYENPSLTAKELGNKISLSTQGIYSSLKKMYGLFDLHKSNENQRIALVIKALKISGYQSKN